MPQKLRIGMAFCAAIATAVVVGACGGGLPSNDVAEVGSSPVTMAAFNHWLVVANDSNQASAGTPAPALPVPPDYTACIKASKATPGSSTESNKQLKSLCAGRFQSLTTDVMNYLIQALWVEAEGKAKGIKVTAKQVSKSFLQQRKTSTPSLATATQLNRFLAASGQTIGDLKWRTYLNLVAVAIQDKVEKAASKVTNAQITAYYNKHHSQFVTPETLDMHLIETTTLAEANSAKSALAGGASYATLVPKDTIDPTTKSTGGKLTVVGAGGSQLPATVSAQAFKAKVGVLSGPVKSPFGYYVFTVDKITPQVTQTLAQARKSVKATIAATQEQAASTKLQADFTKIWEPQTTCRSGVYAVSGSCPNAPKTTSTATGSAQTGSTVVGG
ncbi:MAG TPA: peptidyl-prolyl cis-trans isomerase [Solirubrobacteraceae bacterium]|nr:peptidyl-prolyl cis-trans isomerase [Solirubrobacteraceae bacterium]